MSHNMSLKSIVLFQMLMFVCGKRAAINKIAHKHTKSQRLNYQHASVKSIYVRMKNSTVSNLFLKPHGAELMVQEERGPLRCQGLTRVGDGQQVQTPLLLQERREKKRNERVKHSPQSSVWSGVMRQDSSQLVFDLFSATESVCVCV